MTPRDAATAHVILEWCLCGCLDWPEDEHGARQADAKEEVAEAKEALEKVRQKLAAAANDRPANGEERPQASGRKPLRKRPAEGSSLEDSDQAEDVEDLPAKPQPGSVKRRKSQVCPAVSL